MNELVFLLLNLASVMSTALKHLEILKHFHRFGRQKTFFYTSIALSIFAFATGFASTVEAYIFLRFAVAATNSTVFLIEYVYCEHSI